MQYCTIIQNLPLSVKLTGLFKNVNSNKLLDIFKIYTSLKENNVILDTLNKDDISQYEQLVSALEKYYKGLDSNTKLLISLLSMLHSNPLSIKQISLIYNFYANNKKKSDIAKSISKLCKHNLLIKTENNHFRLRKVFIPFFFKKLKSDYNQYKARRSFCKFIAFETKRLPDNLIAEDIKKIDTLLPYIKDSLTTRSYFDRGYDISFPILALGRYHYYNGDSQITETIYLNSLEVIENNFPLASANVMLELGLLYRNLNHLSEAEKLYDKAVKIRQRMLKKDYVDNITIESILRRAELIEVNHTEEAEKLYNEAHDKSSKHYGPEHPITAKTFNHIGLFYWHMSLHNKEYYEKAVYQYKRAIDILEKDGEESFALAQVQSNLANVYSATSEFHKAVFLLEKALAMRVKLLGRFHRLTINVIKNLGIAYANNGDLNTAIDFLSQSLEEFKGHFGFNHPFVIENENTLHEVKSMRSETDEVILPPPPVNVD